MSPNARLCSGPPSPPDLTTSSQEEAEHTMTVELNLKSDFDASVEEPSSHREKVKQLDLVIRRLNIERSKKLSMINAENSIIRILPTEILIHILLCAAPPIDFDKPKLVDWDKDPYETGHPFHGPNKYARIPFVRDTLAAVSRLWHSIVYSTPEFWTSAAIKLSPTKMQARISSLHPVFQNSGALGVDLKIKFKDFPRYHHYDPPPHQLVLLLEKNATRLRVLRLEDPHSGLCKQIDNRFCNLEGLDVSWSPSARPIFASVNASNAPSLCRLSLNAIDDMVLQWSVITSLDLKEVSVDLCALILLEGRCPHLTKYICRSPLQPHQHLPDSSLQLKRTFPFIKEFGWHASEFISWNELIFENVELPALDTLYWPGSEPDQSSPLCAISASFFSQFSSNRITLYVERPTSTEEILCSVFSQKLNAVTLIVEDCSQESMKAIWHLLDPGCYTVPQNYKMFLPNLREVLFVYMPGYSRCTSTTTTGSANAMLDMIVNRRNGAPEKRLRINFNRVNPREFLWHGDNVAERLSDLVGGGFELEIYETGVLHPACCPSYWESV
ncbi:hypothetical protein NP233_g3968 [Leucocoprinus birnbaumii]|uniref:F-box domain-containing protein n=1 Tax=Leucocoprinus birnbaumii TaxID=56174 RepID=A0AAD5YW04_9AGAR|nr:hypothetical protein NP233_g3968 [Leucocoprinus birnbaumii]